MSPGYTSNFHVYWALCTTKIHLIWRKLRLCMVESVGLLTSPLDMRIKTKSAWNFCTQKLDIGLIKTKIKACILESLLLIDPNKDGQFFFPSYFFVAFSCIVKKTKNKESSKVETFFSGVHMGQKQTWPVKSNMTMNSVESGGLLNVSPSSSLLSPPLSTLPGLVPDWKLCPLGSCHFPHPPTTKPQKIDNLTCV